MYCKVDYLSTYPDFKSMPGMYIQTASPEDMCTSDNMNYIQFNQQSVEMMGIPFDECIPSGPSTSMMYTSSCASTGQVMASMYSDTSCTDLVDSFPLFDNNCMTDDDGDDDGDDDDDDDDDDDYNLVGVISNDYCT
jgi:hypothetical protein